MVNYLELYTNEHLYILKIIVFAFTITKQF